MMIPCTELTTLTSTRGVVGSVQGFNLWQLRESRKACIKGIADIASLSYGNEEAKNPENLFRTIVEKGHLSCLEFVPFPYSADGRPCLPSHSMRRDPFMAESDYLFDGSGNGEDEYPAHAFLVEAPIFVARQWMRHRAFSYLEMSRRYVKDSKVPFRFYGQENACPAEIAFYESCLALYDKLLASGEKPETARRVVPVGAMTKFWVGGYDADWKDSFTKLRSDKHAQHEIRVFSNWIENALSM